MTRNTRDTPYRFAALIQLNEAVVHLTRLRFVERWLAASPPDPDDTARSPWEAARAGAFRSLGFHGLERWGGRPFRWSEPVAMLDGADRGVARFRWRAPGRTRLAWACPPWRAPRDRRFLGLPVHRISWTG